MRELLIPVIAVIVAIVIALFVVDIFNPNFGFFAKVDAGHVGVVEHFGKVRESTLPPGFHITGYFEHVRPVDVRTQRHNYTTEAFSADIQQVGLTIAVNENVSPESAYKLYTTVGMNFLDNLLEPRLLENVKVVVSKYTAESLITSRERLSAEVLERMKTDMDPYGINVTTVSIENIDFTDAYESAVEAKQVATQEKQRAKTLEEQKTMETQQKAERARIEAQADADVKKINADAAAYEIKAQADAQAEANKQIAATISDSLIEYNKAKQWDGKLPMMISSDMMPVVKVGQ